jgi:hypothetical protein
VLTFFQDIGCTIYISVNQKTMSSFVQTSLNPLARELIFLWTVSVVNRQLITIKKAWDKSQIFTVVKTTRVVFPLGPKGTEFPNYRIIL